VLGAMWHSIGVVRIGTAFPRNHCQPGNKHILFPQTPTVCHHMFRTAVLWAILAAASIPGAALGAAHGLRGSNTPQRRSGKNFWHAVIHRRHRNPLSSLCPRRLCCPRAVAPPTLTCPASPRHPASRSVSTHWPTASTKPASVPATPRPRSDPGPTKTAEGWGATETQVPQFCQGPVPACHSSPPPSCPPLLQEPGPEGPYHSNGIWPPPEVPRTP